MYYFKKYYLTLIWAAVIMVLCLMPATSLPKSHFFDIIPFFDKIVHFTLFLILSILLSNEHKLYQRNMTAFFLLFSLCFIYGFSIEVMQELFTTTRHFEWMDGFSDGIGSFIGLLLSYRIHARYLHR
jgi:VanZ family protein